jgi:hypothetical protein
MEEETTGDESKILFPDFLSTILLKTREIRYLSSHKLDHEIDSKKFDKNIKFWA